MKIKMNSIFIGNISKVTSSKFHMIRCGSGHIMAVERPSLEKELYKEDATLIKVVEGGYVDIENIKSVFDEIKIRKCIHGDRIFSFNDIIMPDSFIGIDDGSLFVEKESLKPFDENSDDEISFRKLRMIKR